MEIPVELYAPFGTPHDELQPDFLEDRLSNTQAPDSRVPPAAVALASIVGRIAAQSHHYPIGRIGLQKIAYFATKAGIPTNLEFERRPYGPFAAGLKHLLSQLINNGLIEEASRGRMIESRPGPTLADAELAFTDQLEHWTPQIDRVADLFLRIPTTRKAEIAASVHYVAESLANRNRARGLGPVQEEELVEQVSRWKERREPPASKEEISSAARTLAFLEWIDMQPQHEDDVAFA